LLGRIAGDTGAPGIGGGSGLTPAIGLNGPPTGIAGNGVTGGPNDIETRPNERLPANLNLYRRESGAIRAENLMQICMLLEYPALGL
jgi:hypothetical protein